MTLMAVAADDGAGFAWRFKLRQIPSIDLAGHLQHHPGLSLVWPLVSSEVQVVVGIHARLCHVAMHAFHTKLLRETDHQLNQLRDRNVRRQHFEV